MNIWYWLAVMVSWSVVTHWIIGVPFDMIWQAKRKGGAALDDLADIVRVNVTRLVKIDEMAGLFIIGFVFFILTSLLIAGFYYGVEMAMAVCFLAFPLSITGAMGMSLARRINASPPPIEELPKLLIRHRLWLQALASLSIFLTAMFAMYYTLVIRAVPFF